MLSKVLLHYADNSIIGGFVPVYPEVVHLLCRWHVDPFVNLYCFNSNVFAPAQKNERQLRFDKVKSKTKKTKVILK